MRMYRNVGFAVHLYPNPLLVYGKDGHINMKKYLRILCAVLVAAVLTAALPISAGAIYSGGIDPNEPPVGIIESNHPYVDDFHRTWSYTHPTAAEYLAVTFNSRTITEFGKDYITITDDAGSYKRVYSGTYISGRTIYLPGSSFKISLDTDWNNKAYGFKIVSIAAATKAEYEADTVMGMSITRLAFDDTAFVYDLDDVRNGRKDEIVDLFKENLRELEITVTYADGRQAVYVWGTDAFDEANFLTTYDLMPGNLKINVEYDGVFTSKLVDAKVREINPLLALIYKIQALPMTFQIPLWLTLFPVAVLTYPIWMLLGGFWCK